MLKRRRQFIFADGLQTSSIQWRKLAIKPGFERYLAEKRRKEDEYHLCCYYQSIGTWKSLQKHMYETEEDMNQWGSYCTLKGPETYLKSYTNASYQAILYNIWNTLAGQELLPGTMMLQQECVTQAPPDIIRFQHPSDPVNMTKLKQYGHWCLITPGRL